MTRSVFEQELPTLEPIAARSEREALRTYLAALRHVTAAFAENVVLHHSGPEPRTNVYSLRAASRDAVALTDEYGEIRLRLLLELRFKAVGLPRGRRQGGSGDPSAPGEGQSQPRLAAPGHAGASASRIARRAAVARDYSSVKPGERRR